MFVRPGWTAEAMVTAYNEWVERILDDHAPVVTKRLKKGDGKCLGGDVRKLMNARHKASAKRGHPPSGRT